MKRILLAVLIVCSSAYVLNAGIFGNRGGCRNGQCGQPQGCSNGQCSQPQATVQTKVVVPRQVYKCENGVCKLVPAAKQSSTVQTCPCIQQNGYCPCAPTMAADAKVYRDTRPLRSVASPAFKAAGEAVRLIGKVARCARPFKGRGK
jgi:hypothetical protein